MNASLFSRAFRFVRDAQAHCRRYHSCGIPPGKLTISGGFLRLDCPGFEAREERLGVSYSGPYPEGPARLETTRAGAYHKPPARPTGAGAFLWCLTFPGDLSSGPADTFDRLASRVSGYRWSAGPIVFSRV